MPFSPKPRTTSSARPCGLSRTHRIGLGGLDFIPDLSGALYAPDFATLLVADLHLEKGTAWRGAACIFRPTTRASRSTSCAG